MTHSLILDLPCPCGLAWLLLTLIQVPVSRRVIFAQMLWDCIFWWWGQCCCLTHWDPWITVDLPLKRSLSWLHSDAIMPVFLLHDALILHSAVLNCNSTLLLHSSYHFVVILLPSFSLYLALSPQVNAVLVFISQFEIYLWQEGHRYVSPLLAVEQHDFINFNFLMWSFSSHHETECGESLDNINRTIYEIF